MITYNMYGMKPAFGKNNYLHLTKINKVLQINVISVVDNSIVDHLCHFAPCLERVWKKSSMYKKHTTNSENGYMLHHM